MFSTKTGALITKQVQGSPTIWHFLRRDVVYMAYSAEGTCFAIQRLFART